METGLDNLRWFKSSRSASGACVEVAHLPGGGVAVRDSKDRGRAPHIYTRRQWAAFLAGVKNGEFDLAHVLGHVRRPGRLAVSAGLTVLGRGDESVPRRGREHERRAGRVPRVPDGHPIAERCHLHAIASGRAAA
jgi:uncharacterized protein DUF397